MKLKDWWRLYRKSKTLTAKDILDGADLAFMIKSHQQRLWLDGDNPDCVVHVLVSDWGVADIRFEEHPHVANGAVQEDILEQIYDISKVPLTKKELGRMRQSYDMLESED